ncbi:MAG TPA: SIMPL domain-containing protein [Thermomicrobiales bacterium]|nr:SIMPL domain-containing protein [Thermomicrobiales bacterium]
MDGIRARRIGFKLRNVGLVTGVLALLGAASIGAFGGGGASAQDGTPTAGGEVPATVYVNGEGVVTIAPDTASVIVGVNVIEKTLSEAQAKATDQMTAVIAALKAAGIDEKDIQTVNYSVNILQNYDTNGNPATIEGYQVSNQVNVTVRDLDKLGSILDTVVVQGANAIYGISFYVDDPSAAASQARKLAVQDAKKKADELAAAAGMKAGRVISISETYAPPPVPVAYGRAEAADSAAAVPIQSGTSAVTVDVQVTYEMVPAS